MIKSTNQLPKLFDYRAFKRGVEPYTFVDLVTYVSNSFEWLNTNRTDVVRALAGTLFTVDGLYEQMCDNVPRLAIDKHYTIFFEEFRESTQGFLDTVGSRALPIITLTIREVHIEPHTLRIEIII